MAEISMRYASCTSVQGGVASLLHKIMLISSQPPTMTESE
jgi:hypothetical protein